MTRAPLLRRTPLRPGSKPLRRSRLGRSTCALNRVPLRKCSSKQRKSNREWAQVTRERFRLCGGQCEGNVPNVCLGAGVELDGHHVLARSQGGLNAIENCRALCRACHDFCRDNCFEALRLGLVVRRGTNA